MGLFTFCAFLQIPFNVFFVYSNIQKVYLAIFCTFVIHFKNLLEVIFLLFELFLDSDSKTNHRSLVRHKERRKVKNILWRHLKTI